MTSNCAGGAEQAEAVARACAERLPALVGVYVHGSAALGGFGAASDLDVLVVTGDARGVDRLAPVLAAMEGPHPLELSVVLAADAARATPPWRYLLHVAGTRTAGPGEDPDLLAHYVVARAAGRAVIGPEPEQVFGQVARAEMVAYLVGELDWGLAHGDARYAVLNACRAAAYATDGLVLAKVDGARWWTRRIGPDDVVTRALDAQLAGTDLGPADAAATALVRRAQAMLRAAG